MTTIERLQSEETLTTTQAAKMLGVAPNTVRHWITRGVSGQKLEDYRRGKLRITSKQALNRFFERCEQAQGA